MTEIISAYEHTAIKFERKDYIDQFKTLLYQMQFGDKKSKFFITDDDSVRFTQFVGTLQVLSTTIEVLPKIDYEDSKIQFIKGNDSTKGEEYDKWRYVLIEMLDECYDLKLNLTSNVSLKEKKGVSNILYKAFLDECDYLIRTGLVKKYINVDKNHYSFRGKILFEKHIRENYLHKERMYIRTSEYSTDNLNNQILATTLNAIKRIRSTPAILNKSRNLYDHFLNISTIQSFNSLFERLTYNRKNESYSRAHTLSRLILNSLRPDLFSGKHPLVGMMFDMNKLWEEYLYRILDNEIRKNYTSWKIEYNQKINFWQCKSHKNRNKEIKPDIVITTDEGKKIVLDAKWKIPSNNTPSSTDLMQLFAYSMVTGASKSYLIFPQPEKKKEHQIHRIDGVFKDHNKYNPDGGYMRVSVLNDVGTLNKCLGADILGQLNT
jgi:5-methylcytosine-specific restriction enzyme subunit McrC